jgi:glyoxylate reductase
MTLNNVLVTRKIPDAGLKLLNKKCRVRLWEKDHPIPQPELIKRAKGVAGILCLLTDRIDKSVMDAAGPGLKVISTMAVGFDNIDVAEATGRKIFVGNTPGVLTEATADLTWALILSLARRIVEGDKMMRERKFTGWSPTLLLGADFCGATIGIVGMGRIGKAVAKRAIGFGMKVTYFDANRLPAKLEASITAQFVPLKKLIRESDFISLHCPLNMDTYHLIGKKELSMMKRSAYLINVARGPVVDEKALVAALRAKRIAGAAFDVYEHEPKLTTGLANLENVVLAPHLGSASIQTRNKMAIMAAENLLAGLKGKKPKWCVNPGAR